MNKQIITIAAIAAIIAASCANKDNIAANDETKSMSADEARKAKMRARVIHESETADSTSFTEILIVDDEDLGCEAEEPELIAEPTPNFDTVTDDLRHVDDTSVVEEKNASDQIFQSAEQMPEFPGGEAELMKYVANNVHYPETARINEIQGRVVVRFVVEKDGSVGDVKVARSKDPDLDREAVRVVKTLPNFIPGKSNGQTVRVWFTLPVSFRLQN